MVIRFTKATRFICVCALLLLTALISIGTNSITVSTPYTYSGHAVPAVVYRGVEGGKPTSVSLRQLEEDLAYLKAEGFTVLSEQELVSALRRETPLPASPLLLLFDDSTKLFQAKILPLLGEAQLPWFSYSKSDMLSSELRAAGYPVTRIERVSSFTLEEQLVNN